MLSYAPFPIAVGIGVALIAGYLIARMALWRIRMRRAARQAAIYLDMLALLRDFIVTVHDLDDEGKVIYANDAACLHFGVDRDTLLTWRPQDWDPHFDPSRAAALCETAGSRESTFFETEHRIASGELVPVEVTLICHVLNGVRISICYSRDIRARKAMEAQSLQQQREAAEQAGLRRLSRYVDNTPGYFYTVVLRPDGTTAMPFASPGIEDVYGLSPADVEHDLASLNATIHDDDLPKMLLAMHNSARTLSPFHMEFRTRHPQKGERWQEARSRPQREPDGSVLWHGFTHDITERKRMATLLAEREHNFRSLVENLPDPVFRYDHDCRRTYASPAAERLSGKTSAELIGRTPYEVPLVTGPDNEQMVGNIRHVLATGEAVIGELQYQGPDGRPRHFQNHYGPERGADGGVAGVITIARDITEHKRLEALLRAREEEFRVLVENSPDTIARYGRDHRRLYANPVLVAAMGGDLARILGTTPAEFPGGPAGLEYQRVISAVLEHGKEETFELRWQADGGEACTQVRISPERDAAGRVVQVLATGRDITEIDRYRQKIHHQAHSDTLTGLPNRMLLSDHIRRIIADTTGHGHRFSMMMLDLDHFKEINDTKGHGAGDALLCMAAGRLLACVRPADTVARLGGDEFCVLFRDVRDDADLPTVAGKILRALSDPFVIDGEELFVSCSVGIARYPEDSTDIDALYKYADSAMYHAKNMGRNNFQLYKPEFTARAQERMEIETALRKAQRQGELALYYQPQVALRTGSLVSAEALLRWRRPGHGMEMPDRFIPIAEASGLIVGIGEWVLRTACLDAVRWNRDRARAVRVAVNLSTRQFLRNDLVGSMRRILAETGCEPAWLELEITESLLLEDSGEVANMLEELDGLGLGISIDDFGTGYSALSYLNRFPVRQIKIDRSFVSGIPATRDKCELVKAMLSISAALRLESVAEGVETPEQAAYLMAHGCELAQGYLFGKPMPLAEFQAMLACEDGHPPTAGAVENVLAVTTSARRLMPSTAP